MPLSLTAKRVVRISIAHLPIATKRALLLAEFARQPREIAVPVGATCVVLAHDTLRIDYYTLYGALIDRHFDGVVAGSVVLDIGGHKGYFGARAVADGATRVISFEPVSQNLHYLRSAAADVTCWDVRPEAVGPADGIVTINLSPGSWGHSTMTPLGGESTGTETVPVVALSKILNDAATDAPIVVKINVEGAAGAMVLATSAAEWVNVRYIWADIEVNDPVGASAIVRHLELCGLAHKKTDGNRHLFVRSGEPELAAWASGSTE